MRRASGLFLLLAAGAACTDGPAPAGQGQRAVVYGDDDRLEYFQHPDEVLRARTRESVVALIPEGRLDTSDPTQVQIVSSTLGQDNDLCPGEPFADQVAGASCSGTLVDWDLVLTAGHCVTNTADCADYRFVFDDYYEAAGQLAHIAPEDVFRCRAIVARRRQGDLDYALIQLDRPAAPPRRPTPVRLQDLPLTQGSSVSVVGFPDGIPAKLAANGVVLDDGAPALEQFVATLDTFAGNSGSGVYDPQGVLVGNLVTGQADYVRNGSCYVVNRLPAGGDNGDAEGVVYVARALEGLCAAGWRGVLCGDADGTCSACAADAGCPDGWSCRVGADPAVTWCAAPCAGDVDCPADHTCVNSGCDPRETLYCVGNAIWSRNACGRPVAEVEGCGGATPICVNGACVGGAPGNACSDPLELPAVSGVHTGTVGAATGFTSTAVGSCGGNGPDVVFHVTSDRAVDVVASSAGYDTVLYVRTACEDAASEVLCNDDDDTNPGSRGSRAEFSVQAGGERFLFLDAFRNRAGRYTLTLEVTERAPPDAGVPPDTGVEVPDTGVEAPDTGVEVPDAGVPPVDAGTPDTGVAPTLSDKDSGCGCQAAPVEGRGAPWLAAALLGLLGVLRRPRRQ